jgi:hypothetical protein
MQLRPPEILHPEQISFRALTERSVSLCTESEKHEIFLSPCSLHSATISRLKKREVTFAGWKLHFSLTCCRLIFCERSQFRAITCLCILLKRRCRRFCDFNCSVRICALSRFQFKRRHLSRHSWEMMTRGRNCFRHFDFSFIIHFRQTVITWRENSTPLNEFSREIYKICLFVSNLCYTKPTFLYTLRNKKLAGKNDLF